ncbi:MAG TPA: DUF2232 domain-containing protein [Gemmatimonadota bacterium]|nr:DUF2232 domain-containing protein [Gemmatimonadota bacterium]
MFPAAVAFALHDRRFAARAAGLTVAMLIGASMLAARMGAILLASAALAQMGAAWAAQFGPRRLGLGEVALPAIGGAGLGLGMGAVLDPAAVAGWEADLAGSVSRAGEQAIRRYQALGVDPGTLGSLEEMTAVLAAGFVALWPALVTMALWLGAWLGYRLLARWGRLAPPLARRIGHRSFEQFRLGEPLVWCVIVALASLWTPWEPARRLALNALAIGGTLYALQGSAVALWWMNRRGVGTVTRLVLLGIGLVFLTPALVVGAILLGLAEHWVALRDRSPGPGLGRC